MREVLRRIRGAIGMGVIWGIAWGIGGVVIAASTLLLPDATSDRLFAIFDAPAPALALPGFVAGVIFSIVLGFAGRHRRFSELSVRHFAIWGAIGGIGLALVPIAMASLGLATPAAGLSLWKLTALAAVPFSTFGAASAAGTLAIARRAQGAIGEGDRFDQIAP
jgi:hypothetical protein